MNQAPIFKLTDVHYSYLGRFPALQGINLEIHGPSRTALVGSNGSGKSTLLKILDALYFPDSGQVEFNDARMTREKFEEDDAFAFSFRRRVGFVFQDPETQLFSPTVWDEICYAPLQLGWKKNEIRERGEMVLGQFGLAGLRDRQPHRLSVGEKKRVALASVLVLDPDILLLDEPTAALDPRTQSVLLELLHDWGHNGKTIITATQELPLLREMADRVHVLDAGRIVISDTSENVLGNHELLESTNLVHAHTHKHREVEHTHPHTHDLHSHRHDKPETG